MAPATTPELQFFKVWFLIIVTCQSQYSQKALFRYLIHEVSWWQALNQDFATKRELELKDKICLRFIEVEPPDAGRFL